MRLPNLVAATVLVWTPAWAEKPLDLEVERDRVTAGELARLFPQWNQVPAATEILYTPLPGLSRAVAVAELDRLAVRHGLETAPRPAAPVRLRRRMRPIPEREAEAALAAAIAERHRLSPEDVAVQLVGFGEALAPAGPLRFRLGGTAAAPGRLTTLPLTWITPEGRSGTLWLRGRVALRGAWPEAARALAPNRPLAPADIIFREGEMGASPERFPRAPSEVVGRALARSVGAGEKILRSWLMGVPAVERGALVELRLANGSIELRAPARAERRGSIGEQLPFRNLQSGRLVTARLVNPGQAEVTPQSAPAGGIR